jgi:cell wall-associated NlpC family hydrolase
MRLCAPLCLCLMLLLGCQPSPRYGAGEEGKPESRDNTVESKRRDRETFRNTTTRELIELGRIIQSYLGTPYKGKSQTREGMDCSAFTAAVFDDFNRTKLPATARKQSKTGQKVDRHKLRYGDLVFFRTSGSSVSHVGIYIGDDEFAHSSTSTGVMISNLKEKYWRKRYVGARRILP